MPGFTSFTPAVYGKLQEQGRIAPVGDHMRVVRNKGPLSEKSILLVREVSAAKEESQ